MLTQGIYIKIDKKKKAAFKKAVKAEGRTMSSIIKECIDNTINEKQKIAAIEN